MNARLKNLCIQRGYDPQRIQALVELYQGDEALAEQLITSRMKSSDDTHLKAAYKVVPDDSGDDEYPPELLDALEDAYEQLGSWQPITQALQQLVAPAQPVKARVLSDSGDQSVFSSASKAYIDPLLAALIGTPAKTKAYDAKTDEFAAAWNSDQVGR